MMTLLWTLLGTLEKVESSFNYLWHDFIICGNN